MSPKFVNGLMWLRHEIGSLIPRPQGHGGTHDKLVGLADRIEARISAKADITLD